MIAHYNWDFWHVDESKAFLNAPRIDMKKMYAKFKGELEYWGIMGAIYGLKTSSHDHGVLATHRLTQNLGMTQHPYASGIYMKVYNVNKITATKMGKGTLSEELVKYYEKNDLFKAIVWVLRYVDDYLFTGNNRMLSENFIELFRGLVQCTPAVLNPSKALGMTFSRDRERRTISITMPEKIGELLDKYLDISKKGKKRYTLMKKSQYIVKEENYCRPHTTDEAGILLEASGQRLYLAVVGCLIWIGGYRFDLGHAISYLSWHTREPRIHHLLVIEHLLQYIETTIDVPLILGGIGVQQTILASDASLATGKDMRSVIGLSAKMCALWGCIYAKCSSTPHVCLSSLEGELNGYFKVMKLEAIIRLFFEPFMFPLERKSIMFGDNQKCIEGINGNATMEGVRHALIRVSYMREKIESGDISLEFVAGKSLAVDGLTKVQDMIGQASLREYVMGNGEECMALRKVIEEGREEDD
jgi:hypothetical protein